jgi:GxxExxY protein
MHEDHGTTENTEITEKTQLRNPREGNVIEVDQINRITERIIGAAIEVHRALGPGLLESTYHACLVYELKQQGLGVETEKAVPVVFKEVKIDCGYRIDLLVEQTVIVELKAVQELNAVHEAQILSYLKLSGCPVGLLINFNVRQLIEGIKRFRI